MQSTASRRRPCAGAGESGTDQLGLGGEQGARGARLSAFLRAVASAALVVLIGLGLGLAAPAGAAELVVGQDPVVKRQAGRSGPKVGAELLDKRTARSRTFSRSDGAMVAQVFSEPVNFRDGQGRWRAINNDLVPDGSGKGLTNKASGYDVRLPTGLGDGPVRVAKGGAWVSFALEGAKGSAEVAGNTATYKEALPGVSVQYATLGTAVKENITLASADAPSSFRFKLATSPGLQVKEAGGAVEALDAQGAREFVLAAPFMKDAAGKISRDVSLSVERTSSGTVLVLKADRAWLSSSQRKFPVVVDPTTYSSHPTDCELASGASADSSLCGGPLSVGRDDRVHRVAMKFNVNDALPRNSMVESARLNMNLAASSTTSAQDLDLHELTRSFTGAATWNRFDGTSAWSSPGGDFNPTRESRFRVQNLVGDWWSFGVARLVEGWLRDTTKNHGVLLKAADETQSGVKTFGSLETQPNRHPNIEVVYHPETGQKGHFTFDSQQLSDRSGLQVNVANGNLLVRGDDVRIPGTGQDLGLSRTYNNLLKGVGEVGNGWGLSLGPDWQLIRVWWDGSRILNTPDGGFYRFDKKPDGTFAVAAGFNGTLTDNADGTATVKLNGSNTKLEFDSFNPGYLTAIFYFNVKGFTEIYNSNGLDYVTDTQGRKVTAAYNANGDVTSLTDPTGRVWRYGYTGAQLTSYTDPDGKQTRYEYDASDNLTQITDPNGNATRITYDGDSRATSVTRVVDGTTAKDSTTRFAYEAPTAPCAASDFGKTVVTNAEGHATTYCRDAKDRVTKVRNAAGDDADTMWTSGNNVAKFTTTSGAPGGTLGVNSTFTYDGNDVLTAVTQETGTGGGLTTTFGYNPVNSSAPRDFESYQPSSQTNPGPNSAKTLYGYDDKGNLANVRTDNVQNQATLERNLPNKALVSASIDPDGNRTSYEYDAQGNLTKSLPPAPLGPTSITYDALARIKTVTDGKNQTRTFTYDLLDRITKVAFADGSATEYAYDANGNNTTRTETPTSTGVGLSTYSYDAKNRVVRELLPDAKTNTYTYDRADNLTSVEDGGGKVSYAYGPTNLLASLTEPGSSTPVRFEYDPDGNSKKTVLPNGITIDSPYDAAGRIKSLKATHTSGTVLQNLLYDYTAPDGAGGRKDTTLLTTLKDEKASRTTSYTYDTLDRLDLAETLNGSGTTVSSYKYELSKSGNRLKQTIRDPGAAASTIDTYAYNAANQLTTFNGAGGFAYDANGNETRNSAGRALTYNAKDQTTSITPPGSAATALTHADTDQNELLSFGSSSLQNNLLGEASRTSGLTSTYYTRTNQGELIAQRTGSTREYTLSDERGSIIGLTNAAGSRTATYDYDPYGRSIGTAPELFGYAGGLRGPGGLYHFGARYYDPSVGRWTQQDPINQVSDLREANRYIYVGADPINMIDPQGLFLRGLARKARKAGGFIGGRAKSVYQGAKDGAGIGAGIGAPVGCAAGVAATRRPRGCATGSVAGAAIGTGVGGTVGAAAGIVF